MLLGMFRPICASWKADDAKRLCRIRWRIIGAICRSKNPNLMSNFRSSARHLYRVSSDASMKRRELMCEQQQPHFIASEKLKRLDLVRRLAST